MFKKNFGSGQPLENPDVKSFPKYTKFIENGFQKVVTEEFESDNTKWRRISNGDGTDEVLELRSLEKELEEGKLDSLQYCPPKIDGLN